MVMARIQDLGGTVRTRRFDHSQSISFFALAVRLPPDRDEPRDTAPRNTLMHQSMFVTCLPMHRALSV